MNSPTKRSLAKLRSEGWLCEVTERWNQWSKTRRDLFSFIDVLCIRADSTLAVQATSGSNVSSRIEKIRNTQAAALWLESPTRRIVVHGWARRGARGKRKTWQCREEPITA